MLVGETISECCENDDYIKCPDKPCKARASAIYPTTMGATRGRITEPMVVLDGVSVWVPEGTNTLFYLLANPDEARGSAAYSFFAPSPTDVQFTLEVYGQSGSSDSFFLQLDDNEKLTFHAHGYFGSYHWFGQKGSGGETPDKYTVSAGLHTLYVHGREDGTSLRALKIAGGDAFFVPGAGCKAAAAEHSSPWKHCLASPAGSTHAFCPGALGRCAHSQTPHLSLHVSGSTPLGRGTLEFDTGLRWCGRPAIQIVLTGTSALIAASPPRLGSTLR